jgi:hypothetical protein
MIDVKRVWESWSSKLTFGSPSQVRIAMWVLVLATLAAGVALYIRHQEATEPKISQHVCDSDCCNITF